MKNKNKGKTLFQTLGRSWLFGFKYPPLIVGIACLFLGPLFFFSDLDKVTISGPFSQKETAVIIFLFGVFLLLIWYFVYRIMAKKLQNYIPKTSQGDEWFKE